MKKIFLAITAVSMLFASCTKDEPGGTATEALAGEWYVTVNVLLDGELYEDPYGYGNIHISTYNTAANLPTLMYVDDMANFWDFKVRANCDVNSLTFSTSDFAENESYTCGVKITDGKILLNAATTPSGMPADSIVFNVQFDDDDNAYTYQFTGYRYTGLVGDE
jgi:uncharacterized protein YciU (UPF0263 family)